MRTEARKEPRPEARTTGFFERQASARRNAKRLMLLFGLAVIGIVVAVNIAAILLFDNTRLVMRVVETRGIAGLLGRSDTLNIIVSATAFALGTIGFGSMYRVFSLREGGEEIARQMGGIAVPENTSDYHLLRLRRVVEEMSIASGVPVPKVYVIEHEAGINAFAAGYSPSDAVIAVTRGSLDKLNRSELQGVIAHEYSHILNGDMRLNIRLIGMLFGIMMLALIGRKVLQHGSRMRGRQTPVVLGAALVTMLIGYVGLSFGRMIKASVCRSREMLADASAVQFTRQTSGLAGALKKIAGVQQGALLSERAGAEEVSHMLFGDGTGLHGLFATHPPLLKRIQALEPSFKAEALERLRAQWQASPPDGLAEDRQLGLIGSEYRPGLPESDARLVITPPRVAAQVAAPENDDYPRAGSIVSAIGNELHDIAMNREQVMPLLLGLVLNDDTAIRQRQCNEVAARLGKPVAAEAWRLREKRLAALHPMLRLPLATLAFPVLRGFPRAELVKFLVAVRAVTHADGNVSLFEYCLGRLLQTQLREVLNPSRHARIGRGRPGSLNREIATLLAVVAQAGSPDAPAQARRAYLAGMQRMLPGNNTPYAPTGQGPLALDAVWEPLDGLDPESRETMVEALTITISHDGYVSVAEAELLRTICAVLHCPLPPMLEQAPVEGTTRQETDLR